MQALLGSLVVSMGVQDTAFRAGMATARDESRKTAQDFQKSGNVMSDAFDKTAIEVNAAFNRMLDKMAQVGRDVRNVGLGLTAGLTLPLGAMAVKAKSSASTFEAAMNAVHSAMVDVDPKQLDELRAAAMSMGPAFGRSSIEAASAMEDLAKNGMSAADILGGGLKSALTLAVVGETDLGSAADTTTDILAQFHRSTADLPEIVDKVSGALDASKLSFNGYRDAIGQVGGIAGGLGYSFDDMNTALAAVIPLMSAGSDAGTSFKTFLTSLTPQSKQAEYDMKQLGISFYDANHQAKSLGEIAEVLNKSLSGLNDQKRTQALKEIFGDDGMRVAIALMQAGAKGIADMQAQIDKVKADQKLAILLDGEAAATQRVATAWENLKIVIAQSGLLQFFTVAKDTLASFLTALAGAPPWFYKLVAAAGILLATLGPMLVVMPLIAKVGIVALIGRLGPLGLAFGLLVNPIGVIIRLLVSLAIQMGLTSAAAASASRVIALASGFGLLATALSIIVPLYLQSARASDEATVALDKSSQAREASIGLAGQLATAVGREKDALLEKAKADRAAAAAAIQSGKATLAAARAENLRARVQDAKPTLMQRAYGVLSLGSSNWEKANDRKTAKAWGINISPDRMGTALDYQAAGDAQKNNIDRFNAIDQAIKAAEAPSKPTRDVNLEQPGKDRNGGKGRDTSADAADYAAKLADARQDVLDAHADATENPRARYAADVGQIAKERADYIRQLATDQAITSAKADELLAIKDQALADRKIVANKKLSDALAQQDYDLAKAANSAQQDQVQATIELADNAADRRAGELRLLDLQRQQEGADLDLILATKATSSAEWQNAADRKRALGGIYADKRASIVRQTEGPAEGYMRSLNATAATIDETVQSGAVDALKDLNTGLSDAILGAKSLADAFADMGKKIIASLLDIAIQQAIIKPLAQSLFGGSLLSGVSGTLGSLFGTPSFGGGRATGGGISADQWYTVGERGPERFYPGVSGTVVPNAGRGAARTGAPVSFDLRGALVTADVLAQMQDVANETSGRMIGDYAGKVATRNARTLR